MLEDGFTDAQTARAFEVSEALVKSIRAVNAIPRVRGKATPIRSTTRRAYSEQDKAQSLLVLDANGGNIKRTARQIGIPVGTLRAWRDNREMNAASPARA
jgi:hypothetical protein